MFTLRQHGLSYTYGAVNQVACNFSLPSDDDDDDDDDNNNNNNNNNLCVVLIASSCGVSCSQN
jgi:hypothetical protein